MEQITGSKNFPSDGPNPVLAMGNFDGVHLAHRRIIEQAVCTAKNKKTLSAVYTFEPHPVRVLSPAECPPLIQTLKQKLDAIEKTGVGTCIVETFTHEFARLSAEDFFRTVIVERLHASAVVVGYDFTFGLHRQGTVDTLDSLGDRFGIDISVLEAQFLGEALISSTNIRRMIASGDVKDAAGMLGFPYRIDGKVVAGQGLGRKIGAHTANIITQNELIPKDGVYLTQTSGRPSITSIGMNPTFHEAPFSIETHIINYDADLMGQEIKIEFIDWMRDQIAFKSADMLARQIKKDIQAAKEMHKKEL